MTPTMSIVQPTSRQRIRANRARMAWCRMVYHANLGASLEMLSQRSAAPRTWSCSACARQRREQIDHIPVGVRDLRVALAPERVPRRLVPVVPELFQARIQAVHLGRLIESERQDDC